jgi:hypothetical protein
MNFASRGKVTINLTKNVIGGPLDIIGGLSRPDAVSNATTTINSHGNHYSPQPPSDVAPLLGARGSGARAREHRGNRNYLVLAKPNVIMNDIRLRGLGVAGSDPAGRKSPHNHAQTARNLRRSLRNAAAGARLIQADGLDSKSAADVAASLADALEELRRLKRSLDRRIRRDRHAGKGPSS